MSTSTTPFPVSERAPMAVPAAAFEVLGYLAVVAVATLSFVAGWLTPRGACDVTAALLAALVVLAWRRLDRGRHPCFLFLCTLMLFQGGRLIAYCLGAEPDPLRVVLMGTSFDLAREEQGITLLCVALAAICVYTPSRWMFRHIAPPDTRPVQKYVPYLYLLFALTLPAQLFKNYKYYEFAMAHGGYLSLFFSHSAITATIPFFVRAAATATFPVFIAIFVFERRKRFLYFTTLLYIATASVMLMVGGRGGFVTMILTLWWIARVKSRKSPRIVIVVALSVGLLFVGDVVRKSRGNGEEKTSTFTPLYAVFVEGAPLNMTEIAIHYRQHFSRYSGSYILRELKGGFVPLDNLHYRPGETLDFDASVLLNPVLFNQGNRVAESYIGEAYIAGGVVAVILVSFGVGTLLAAFYNYSGQPVMLLLFAFTLQDILIMPRTGALAWLSVLARNLVVVLIGLAGWKIYALVTSIRSAATISQDQAIAGPTAST